MSFRDPFFHRPSKKGSIGPGDYTKHIKWTPPKIAIAVLCIGIPYLAIVIAVAASTSIWATIPFIVLPLLMGGLTWLLYRMAR